MDRLQNQKVKEHAILEQRIETRAQKIARLKTLAKAYSEYEPYKAVSEESNSLIGMKKVKFDRDHKQDLCMYQEKRQKLKSLLQEGEKVTPKAWNSEHDALIKE